jgi:signal transduction histidine kinase
LVLVIEDNPEMNRFITGTLGTEYRTATALNGQEGLEQALALHPDLILSDVMMPQMSGDQFVHQLRTYPELDTTPVILVTAKADDELRVQLLREGAQDYLMKPFSVEELRARVGNLIAIKRVRDLLQQELTSKSQDLEALVQEVSLRRRELQIALESLRQQAKQLEEANRLKDEFLAIVSHELRTPLNAILGCAQILRNRKPNESTTARALETIERNAKSQIQLVENLLDISRALRGKLLLDSRPVELKPVIEAAINAVQAAADAKAIQLESFLDENVGSVSGEPERLQQIVENLLSNAIKFTPEGGRVDIRLLSKDSDAQLQVIDTGTGISAEFLPHVFDYFRQADSSMTRKHGGLGLGLAIVRQLVQLHNGTIQVESPGVGQGSTFTITLPLAVKPNLTRYLY